MKQLVQSVRSGDLRIVDAPDPEIGPTEVLVQTSRSVVSAGTERAVRQLASANLLQKAKARPDLVRQVIKKARSEGLRSTFNAVQARLEDDMPLGYSAAGTVIEVGEYVSGIRPGMRVATGGAGHADLQVVSGNLTVPVPDDVSLEAASFSTVAAIALHGLRQADVGPGGKVCVVGLGLIGQLTVRLAQASGLDVVGIDLRKWTVDKAIESGAYGLVEQGDETTRVVMDWSRGRGVDAVLLTAATSSSDPALRSADIARDRATIVVIGDVGMSLQRTPLYEKELTIKVARSYGPGRYDRSYEEWAVDYPIGHVRWTERRNLEAVMDLMDSGRLQVDDLITHRFGFDRAKDAYELLNDPSSKYLGIQLAYQEERAQPKRRVVGSAPTAGPITGISLLGAGSFAKSVLVPSIDKAGLGEIKLVASAGGVSASRLAAQIGATAVSTDEAIHDPSTNLVVIATPHESHADLVIKALKAGKHVFCEKPLAITHDELDAIEEALTDAPGHLAVGFNRRHSPMIKAAIAALGPGTGPLSILYRVNAGRLPEKHWYHDRKQGGRLMGEVCHFVDTCNAIVGEPAISTVAADSSAGESILAGAVSLLLSYPDGSIAAILYAIDGHPGTPKEQVQILGRGHTVVIEDFQSMTIDGQARRVPPGKGHNEEFLAFGKRVASDDRSATVEAIASTRLTIMAATSLMR